MPDLVPKVCDPSLETSVRWTLAWVVLLAVAAFVWVVDAAYHVVLGTTRRIDW